MSGAVVLAIAFASACATSQSPGSSAPKGHTEETTHFTLTSGVRTNLYHFLFNWALAGLDEAPPWAPTVQEREDGLNALPDDERTRWTAAVQTFADLVSRRSVVFDEGLIAVRAHVAGAPSNIPASDRPLVAAVDAVLDIYERRWWPAHHRANVAWIEALSPSLRQAESMMTSRLAAAYGGTWPEARLPIDVAVYTVPVGAYSTSGRVTMTSLKKGYRMPHALEMVLHEASHLGSLEPALRESLDAAFAAAERTAPKRFWHELIFYTSGELTRVAYETIASGAEPYRHYGEATGVYTRGAARWSLLRPVLDQTWRPFVMRGSSDETARRAALDAMVRALPADLP